MSNRTKKIEYEVRSSLYLPSNRVDSKNGGDWDSGFVITKRGIVGVYAQGDDVHMRYTSFYFVYHGKCLVKTYKGIRMKGEGITRKAREFLLQIENYERQFSRNVPQLRVIEHFKDLSW